MRKIFIVFALSAVSLLGAENLIRNPECDGDSWKIEFRAAELKQLIEVTQFVEEYTWNRCIKLTLKDYFIGKDGKKSVGAGVMIGGDQKKPGFHCNPDTLYEFKFELKGNAPRAMVNFYQWDSKGKMIKKQRTSAHDIRPQNEWNVFKGTFRTAPNAARAALYIQFWGDERRKDLKEKIGQYVLIDKVMVTQADDFKPGTAKSPAVSATNLKPAAVYVAGNSPETAVRFNGFRDTMEDRPAKLKTNAEIYCSGNALKVNIDCYGPVTSDAFKGIGGNGIWKDDIVEIFFQVPGQALPFHQFVISAGTGRWMGNGLPGKLNKYDLWKSKVIRNKDYWRVEVEIPFAVLGYKTPPAKGEYLRFNLCRQHPAAGTFLKPDFTKGNRFGAHMMFDNSSVVFTRGVNRDIKHYPYLFLETMKPFCDKALASAAAEKADPTVKALVAKIDPNQPGIAFAAAEELAKRLQYLKLSKEPFLLAQISPAGDFSLPFFPKELQNHGKTFKIRAAVNEQAPLVLALANMGKLPEEFRVFVNSGWAQQDPSQEFGTAVTSLKSADGTPFPAEKIVLRRGIPSRDADTPNHGRIIDILAKLNEAGTIPVQPNEAGLLWITFDCSGVKPGIYKGRLTVIPLDGANISFRHAPKASYNIKGASKDFPIELEVLPITLPEKSPMPFNGYARVNLDGQSAFLDSYDCFMQMVTPWYFTFTYRPDGSIAEYTTRSFLEPQLKRMVTALRKNKNMSDPKLMIGYSVYPVWKNKLLPKTIKFNTPEYWNAWRNFCLGIDKIMKSHNISRAEYTMEIFDEPNITVYPPEELERAHAEYKKAMPDASILMTSGVLYMKDPATFKRIAKDIDIWIFHQHQSYDAKVQTAIKNFKALSGGRKTGIYMCGTSLRGERYSYYRMLPWNAMLNNCDFVSLYQMYPQSMANDLFTVPKGEVAYILSDTIIPSVRLEIFRMGLTDVKYLKLLENLSTGKSKEAAANRAFVRKSLRETALIAPHDTSLAAKIREEAITRILKLQNKGK